MHRFRTWMREIFRLSHGQANGLLVLFPLMMIVLFSQPVWHWYISRRPIDFSRDSIMLDSLVDRWTTPPEPIAKNIRLFRFDPNTSDSARLRALGFSPALAARIVRFRSKGGKFRIRADLGKIYGLDSAFYSQLYPYIDLPVTRTKNDAKAVTKKPERPRFVRKDFPSFDLNTADTSMLKKIRGVGDKLSVRIVRYRDALGGFISVDQLHEVYGLDSVVVSSFRQKAFIDPAFEPRRLNINDVSEKELAAHPYLERPEARSVVSYRFQHGEFSSVEDLGKIAGISPGTLTRMRPYLRAVKSRNTGN